MRFFLRLFAVLRTAHPQPRRISDGGKGRLACGAGWNARLLDVKHKVLGRPHEAIFNKWTALKFFWLLFFQEK